MSGAGGGRGGGVYGSSLETSSDQNSIHIPKLCVYLIITHAIISAGSRGKKSGTTSEVECQAMNPI